MKNKSRRASSELNMDSVKLFSCTLFLAALLFGNGSCEIYFKKGAPHVKLGSGGLISGTVKFSREGRPYNTFQGIQYATAERFGEPQLVTTTIWEGVRTQVQPGPMCLQRAVGQEVYFGEEECLYLDVHVPMNNTGKNGYPVMVWIHGGGFNHGTGSGYSPQYFMDEDVIVVTINYRLSVLGFLSSGDEVIPGNFGLKDQVMALRWVQANIKEFGGDPGKVTIFGESAGGASVHLLTLSPTAKGLFHRAIAQSGSGLSVLVNDANPRAKAIKLAEYLKCPTTTSQEILNCLKEKTSDELVKAAHNSVLTWPNNLISLRFIPTTEPEANAGSQHTPFLTQSPWSIITDKTRKSLADVPMIFGDTTDEGVHFFASTVLRNPDLMNELNSDWEGTATKAFFLENTGAPPEIIQTALDKVKEFYFGTKEISQEVGQKLSDLYSDVLFSHGISRASAETAAKSSEESPVYLYQFAQPNPASIFAIMLGVPDNDPKKVGHGDELTFLFSLDEAFSESDKIESGSVEEEFSKNFIRLWVSFAKYGKPTYTWGNVEKWEPLPKTAADRSQPVRIYRLESDPKYADVPYLDRMNFWDKMYEEHLLSGVRFKANAKVEL